MELDPDYTFVPLAPRHYMGIENKNTQRNFMKWGLLGNISIQDFCFNEPFQPYNKYHIAEQFFKDDKVVSSLLLKEGDAWINKGIAAATVEITPVPCTVFNMSFFDKLTNSENGICGATGNIRKQCDLEIDNFIVSDKLRSMILDEDSCEYNLFSSEEREEFIFRLLQLLVLGGVLCQYEDEVKPYLDTIKIIYKDLVRVHKKELNYELSIGTTVLQVVARDARGEAFFPSEPEQRQNIGFLLIDGTNRQITTLLHQFGAFHSW
ncbi:hypothetical protein TKK_0002042 [Trichogramma kaykai]|uniref:Cilia- and flagella-associated protein 300 n=1 Tax=Trichogramma kaykai TaxID=54128 RepID=A0ABD2XA19_9HYME